MSTVAKVEKEADPAEEERQQRIQDKPLLDQCYNLLDFESVAKQTMKKGAWGYYSSAADDEIVSRTQSLVARHSLLTHPLDIPREPRGLPQDMVPPQGLG